MYHYSDRLYLLSISLRSDGWKAIKLKIKFGQIFQNFSSKSNLRGDPYIYIFHSSKFWNDNFFDL